MNKELEAFYELKESVEYKGGDFYCANEQRLNIIETALKEHEEYKQILNDYGLSLVDFRHACFTFAQFKNSKGFEGIEKKLKALEIIKKLFKDHLNIDYDKNHDFYEIWTSTEYEDVVIASGQGKEEYDLLKGVLQ